MFDRMSLRAKLIGVSAVSAALLLAISWVGAGQIGRMVGATQQGLQSVKLENAAMAQVQGAHTNFKTQVQEWKNILIRGNDPANFDKHLKQFNGLEKKIQAQLREAGGTMTQLGMDVGVLETLRKDHAELGNKYRAALVEFEQRDPNAGKHVDKLVKGIDKSASAGMEKLSGDIEAHFAQRIAGQSDLLEASEVSASRLFAGLALAGLAGLVVLSVWMLRDVMRQLGGEPAYAAEVANRIAQGDLDLTIREAVSAPGSVLHAMRSMQQSLRERGEASRARADENLRIRSALDRASTAMMLADTQGVIVYCNDSVMALLQGAEKALREALPNFSASKVLGQNFDVFHKNPAHQRGLLSDLKATHVSQIKVGPMIFRLTASPVFDATGQRLGTTLEWLDRSSEALAEEELGALMGAAVRGDFSQRLRTDNKRGFFVAMSENMNRLLDIVSAGLGDVGRVLNAMARGDLTEKVRADYAGVFGQLKDDTNATVLRLAEVMAQIQGATDAVGTAARDIATGNTALSRRTEEQAGSLEETSASMEELNATVKANADNASEANALARTSNAAAVKGGETVRRVVETMSAIQASSQKISDIIGVIDAIAFQTNILALNAAVEAARAGEQGRGFAVVASEVRNLAQRSAQAAKEIKTLISDSVGRVDAGARQVSEAGQSMDEVVASFQKVVALVTEISLASREQASGIAQVTRAVGEMDEATQRNGTLVEQAAQSANDLEQQAQALAGLVAGFKLGR